MCGCLLKKYDWRFYHVFQGFFLYFLEVSRTFNPLINNGGDLVTTLQAKLLKLFLVLHHLLKLTRLSRVLPIVCHFGCINASGFDLIEGILNE